MWYIIPHTRTKISRTRVHTGTRQTDGFFFWDVSIRNSLRSNKVVEVEAAAAGAPVTLTL